MDEIMNSRSQSQEVFERVWARVMGSAAPQTAAQPQPEPVSQPAPEAQPVMSPQTMAAHIKSTDNFISLTGSDRFEFSYCHCL